LEALTDGLGRLGPRDFDLIDLGTEPALLSLGEERGLPRFAVFAREPVRRQPSDGRGLPDEDTAPVFGDHSALRAKLLYRLPGRHPCHAVVLLQLGLGRKLVAGPKLTGFDC
jgi:hypothetical protein